MYPEQNLRTKTGIQLLDSSMKGGIPKGNITLISGGAGTGKSTLCLQILLNGAVLYGEKGLYISTEQTKEELLRQASGFGWNLIDLEQKNLLKIVYFDITGGDSFLEKMNSFIQAFQPKRLVIDSLTTLTDSLLVSGISDDKGFSMVQIAETVNPIPRTEQIVQKNILYHLFKELKKYKITTILTTELPEDEKHLSGDGISEFVADGVIVLNFLGIGGIDSRSLRIRKMRYTDHVKDVLNYDMSSTGIVVSENDSFKV